MKHMKSILIVAALVVTAIIVSGFLSNQNNGDIRKPVQKKTDSKEIIKVKTEPYSKTITTTGRMYAFEKVEIYSEVSGVLENSSIKFKEGKSFNKNETLLSVNSDVYENSLKSLKSSFLNQLVTTLPDLKFDFPNEYSKWDSYLKEFSIDEPINSLPETNTERERFYLASKNIFKLFYDIKSTEATFNKYSIKAPFNGVVTLSNINPGTLVRNGQKLGEFINTNLFEMEAVVKLDEAEQIKIGTEVKLKTLGSDELIGGKLVRINKSIDQQTQSIKIFIQSRDSRIKDGMFFSAELNGSKTNAIAKLPKEAVKNNIVKIQNQNSENEIEIEIFDADEEYVFVKGLEDESLVIIETTVN